MVALLPGGWSNPGNLVATAAKLKTSRDIGNQDKSRSRERLPVESVRFCLFSGLTISLYVFLWITSGSEEVFLGESCLVLLKDLALR